MPQFAQTPEEDSIRQLLDLAKEYNTIGDYATTEQLLRQTHQMRKRLYSDSSVAIIYSYTNLSRIMYHTWEYDSALHYLRLAEKTYTYCTDCTPSIIADVYSYMGRIYSTEGDYLQARIVFKRAEEYYRSDLDNPKSKYIHLLLRMGHNERLCGNYDLANQYFERYFKLAKKTSNNAGLLQAYYQGLSFIETGKGNLIKSMELQEITLGMARQDSASDPHFLAQLYNNLGMDYTDVNQLNLAENFFQRAMYIYKTIDINNSDLAGLYESIGRLHAKRNELNKALSIFQKGLRIGAPDFTSTDIMENPKIHQIEYFFNTMHLLKSKALCLLRLFYSNGEIGYLDCAIEACLITIDIFENQRNNIQTYESKLQSLHFEYEVFNMSMDLLALAYQKTGDAQYIEKAFSVSERSKSSLLLTSLRELDARQMGEIPDSLLNREEALNTRISFYKNAIYEELQSTEPDSIRINNWEHYLFTAQREHSLLIDLFEKQFPKYHELKYDPTVVELGAIQKLLGNRTSLLQYSLTDSALHAFFVSNDKLVFKTTKVNDDFKNLLVGYLNNFHRFDFSRQSLTNFTSFCRDSKALYDILIKPFEEYLSDEKLIIVPDDKLSYLPFETLLSNLPEDIPAGHHKDLDYMIRKHSISYSYSSTLYELVNESEKRTKYRRLLAFAPSYELENKKSISEKLMRSENSFRANLFPLPGAIEEVETIEKLLPSDVFSRLLATEESFRDTAAYYDIIHLAMHAYINNQNPLYSKLIFTSTDDSINDGMLNTYEVFGLKLNARMVVLSACSTGDGEYSRGEGVLSLARGFVYAGAPSLVMTLWQVEDKSGSKLMKEFYKQLRRGRSKSKALQIAKIKYLENARPELAHPFFWSSFAVLGNPEPLYFNRIALTGISVAVFFILLAILRRLRIRKRRATS